MENLIALDERSKQLEMTPAGRNFLEPIVTDTEGDVYTFTGFLDGRTVAAAMARLSRSPNDMRITILKEFSDLKKNKDEKLLSRIITAYGDDSVQQLVGAHIVVEGASNLLTKELERGRLAAYLEQSTRYIYFDQKDQKGRYKYYIPEEITDNDSIKNEYVNTMDSDFENYSRVVRQLTEHVRKKIPYPQERKEIIAWKNATRAQACDAARGLLPVSTKSTVGIFASAQSIESMIMKMAGSNLKEVRTTAQKILDESRKVIGVFLERADRPDRGGATTAYYAQTRNEMRSLISEHWTEKQNTSELAHAHLEQYYPENELDILPYMLFEHSKQSIVSLRQEIESQWSQEEKIRAFQKYMGERLNRRHTPGRALELPQYTWDIVCDYGIFRDLQRHRIVNNLERQSLTPYLGYQIPELVQEAKLDNAWEQCFEASYNLYERLDAVYGRDVAQYATLLAHHMRWTISYNARQAFHMHELRTSPQGHPGYRRLINAMHLLLSTAHPLIAEAMSFVNEDEDPELTRLAAERYQQFKLSLLKKS